LAIAGQRAEAGDYSFDLPQLVGNYLGDIPSAPTIELVVDLGLPFTEINGATLRLAGSHSPGLFDYVGGGQAFTASAEVIAWLPTQHFLAGYVDELLPMPGGAFELTLPFRSSGPGRPAPTFDSWLDGEAELNFTVASPPMIAIYSMIEPPAVTIDSATLILHGQPRLDELMLDADFNDDGAVDGEDLRIWKTAFVFQHVGDPTVSAASDLMFLGDADSDGDSDGSDFIAWQRQLRARPLAAASPVPEPTALGMIAPAVGVLLVGDSIRRSRDRSFRGC
jgi:hypothetical protein